MKALLVAAVLLHLALGASIVDVTCPDSCTCQATDEYLETSCLSYEFIKKLLPKQESTIVRLNINNASLVNVDLKLKYLKNLHSLDLASNEIAKLPSHFPYLPKLEKLNLSRNHLTNVVLSQLPKNLEVVDLSHNAITSFPKDWSTLKHLTTLYLHDNPIDCDCDNLSIYEQLLKGGIALSGNLTCHSPTEFYGRVLNSVNCTLIKENLLNSMLGDESGSGAEELETGFEENAPLVDDQLFSAEGVTQPPVEEGEEEEEGSGDEGSGEIPIFPEAVTEPKACHFNCSTPHPIGLHDEKDASPPPNVLEQAKTIFEDILQPEKVDEDTVPPTTTEIEETSILKEVEEPVMKKSDKDEVETFPTNVTVGEMERASLENSNTQSVYIVVGLIVAFIAFLLVYFINKKRNQRRRNNRKRNKSNENGFGEEMKPLGKTVEAPKTVENNSKLPNSETSPLLNGQNGKISEDAKVKAEPETDAQPENELEDVELRKPDREETLTPQPERVTIKAGELPDSVPKTPLLVHRQLNSDGEIVTTAVNSN